MNILKPFQSKLNSITSWITPPPDTEIKDDPNKILIIFTHPQGIDSFAHAAMLATIKGLRYHKDKNDIKIRRLYYDKKLSKKQREEECIYHNSYSFNNKDFKPVLSRKEHIDYMKSSLDRSTIDDIEKSSGKDCEIVKAVKDIRWADKIVFVHPTWWFHFPTILKGYFDRIMLPGISFRLPNDNDNKSIISPFIGLVPLLTNIKKIGVVTSYGSKYPTPLFLDGSRQFLSQVFRRLCHSDCELLWLSIDQMDTQTEEIRKNHLKYVEDMYKDF